MLCGSVSGLVLHTTDPIRTQFWSLRGGLSLWKTSQPEEERIRVDEWGFSGQIGLISGEKSNTVMCNIGLL